jgi:hypothetical protein
MKLVVVTLCDEGHFFRARRTIIDTRTRGQWNSDLVLITVGFDPPRIFFDYYNVTQFRVEHIDTTELINKYKQHPIRPTCDNREFSKLTQWDKFYVFDPFFSQWDKVIYLDAGLRVFDKIQFLADIPCNGLFLAPDDAAPDDENKRFGGIIETDINKDVLKQLWDEYDPSILTKRYFLNCIWMYDTSLLKIVCLKDFIDAMNKYPICRCNEMTIMNLIFTFKHDVWKPFPEFVGETNKTLFGWTEQNGKSWRDFCFIKYPFGINYECE